MSRLTPPFIVDGKSYGYHRFYPPIETDPQMPPGWPGRLDAHDNGWSVAAFADENDDPTNAAAAPLPDPGPGEYNQLAHLLVRQQDNPVWVLGAGGYSDDPEIYSTGELPTLADDLVVPDGATLTIVGGSDTFRARHLRVSPGGNFFIEKGTDANTPTYFEIRTLIVHRGGTAASEEADADGRIVGLLDNTYDIDAALDPQLVSLGLVLCEGSIVALKGKKRRHIMAFTNEMVAGVTDTITLGHPIYIDDPNLPEDEWMAGDYLFNRGAHDATGILAGHKSLGGEMVCIASRDGADAALTQPCANSHTGYWDEARRVESATLYGPPSGSHAAWWGRGAALNVTRFFQFREKDPTAPRHRQPYCIRTGHDNALKWVELQGFGRTDGRRAPGLNTSDMKYPGGQVNTAETNLRFREPCITYRAGYVAYNDMENWPAGLEGLSVWGGPVRHPLGDTYANNAIGAGSLSRGIAFYESTHFARDCVVVNTIGAGMATYSFATPGLWYRCWAAEQWGMNGADAEPILKNNYDYQNHDMGARGEGFFRSRLVAMVQCGAIGCKNVGFHTSSRAESQGATTIQSIFCNLGPQAFEYRQFVTREQAAHAPLLREGLYSIGCRGHDVIIKSVADMNHSIPSHLKNDLKVANRDGEHFEYAGNYPVINNIELGPNPVGDRKSVV